MITEIKLFILLLIISMIPSEMIYFPEENSCFCNHQMMVEGENEGFFSRISEIKNAILAKRSSENRDILTNYDENKTDSYQNNNHTPFLYFFETSARTIDWISHFKRNLQKLLAQMIQEEVCWTELLPFQIYSNDIYIPELTYYIYTLEEITI